MEFNFDLKRTDIFQAVKWSRHPLFSLAGFFKKLFLILSALLFLAFLYGFIFDYFAERTRDFLLGSAIISLVLGSVNWLLESFLNSKLKKPKLKANIDEVFKNPANYNLAEFLSFEAAEAVWKSIKFARERRLAAVNSSILFYYLIVNNPKLNFIFSRALLSLKQIKKIIEAHFKILKESEFSETFSEDFQDTVFDALKNAQKKGRQRIKTGDILVALTRHDLIFKKVLIDADLKPEDIESLTWWLEDLKEKIAESRKFWEWKNLVKKSTLAKEWATGYTVTLDRFSIDITGMMRQQGFREIFTHKREVAIIERILISPEKNDALIIGEPGSGRRSIIEALANKAALGESLPEINYKKVVQLDLVSLIAQITDYEQMELVLDTVLQEAARAGNIILVIDELHNYISGPKTTAKPGTIDISGMIGPYLKLPNFQVIAITNFEGLHKNIEQNPSMLSLFEKVEVPEVSEKETLYILQDRALRLENKYKIFISYPALRDVISLSGRYLPALPFPEKAMDLLDEVSAYVSQHKEKILLPKHVAKIVSQRAEIPVGEIDVKEKEVLLDLENLIHQRIINQEEAVDEVSSALRRARAEITVRNKPMGNFLFLGPTGVGKTETSKALAEIYFGSESRMIRMDMSEFQATADIPRLIGSPGEEGFLTTQVRENPFSLILLDEIEKAHPNILNLFLQVLDEGHLTDGLGRKVDFKNTIIIATSNAGYQVILETLKQKETGPSGNSPAGEAGQEWQGVKQRILDYLFKNAIFRPEFINRFDAVVVFKPLSKENLLDIAELLLQKLKNNLAKKDIDFIISPALKEKIVELSYDPTFGAREMQRIIQNKVENVLAQAVLSGELKKGNRAEIDPDTFQLLINR